MLEPRLIKLDVISTPEGTLFPVYKDWESFHSSYVPKMVYVTTIASMTQKGPILHRERGGYMTAIKGTIVVECLVNKELKEYALTNSDGSRNILLLPKNIPNLIKNISDEEAILINLPDKAWHPENEDTQKFNSWEDIKIE